MKVAPDPFVLSAAARMLERLPLLLREIGSLSTPTRTGNGPPTVIL